MPTITPDMSEHVQRLADGRWVVATWHPDAGQYVAPMNPQGRRANPGADTVTARRVDNLWLCNCFVYQRRSSALRKARQLYGGEPL